jgi:hypothetical protein
MKGLMATVTNVTNGKGYFVSTVKSSRNKGFHETAVYQKIFRPFANFWRPQATFSGSDAPSLHARVTELVRDFDPEYWRIFSRG